MAEMIAARPATDRYCHSGVLRTATFVALTAIFSAPAAAQRVEGRVVDAGTGEPIATALVQLIAADSTVLASVATNARGGFRLDARQAGVQFLRVTRTGYGGVRASLAAMLAEASPLVVRLVPAPVALPALAVDAEARNRFLESVGFYNRQRLGIGEFVTRDMIARNHANARAAGEILQSLRGLLVHAGQEHDRVYMIRSMSRVYGECGARVYINGSFHGNEVPHVRPDGIEAIEVFRGPADVPSQYGGVYGACGVVLIWLRTGQS